MGICGVPPSRETIRRVRAMAREGRTLTAIAHECSIAWGTAKSYTRSIPGAHCRKHHKFGRKWLCATIVKHQLFGRIG